MSFFAPRFALIRETQRAKNKSPPITETPITIWNLFSAGRFLAVHAASQFGRYVISGKSLRRAKLWALAESRCQTVTPKSQRRRTRPRCRRHRRILFQEP